MIQLPGNNERQLYKFVHELSESYSIGVHDINATKITKEIPYSSNFTGELHS